MVTVQTVSASDMIGHNCKSSLYIPTMRLYKVEEYPIVSRQHKTNIKNYLNQWESKLNSYHGFNKVHSVQWNNPEGCVSVIQELNLGGTLQGVLDGIGSLPESCLKELAT